MRPSELLCFKDTKNVQALFFFLAASNKKFHRENAQPYACAANANANKAG